MQNFRPGVVRRLGFDYSALRELNPNLIYGSISGYGDKGPWVKRPGQGSSSPVSLRAHLALGK